MQNIQRKLDRLLQRESIDFINHENAGRRIKAWEDFFSQTAPTLPPLISVKNTDHQIIDNQVLKYVSDLIKLIMRLPLQQIHHPDKTTADEINKCLITPRLTAAILARLRSLFGASTSDAHPYFNLKSRSEISEPYYLLLIDMAAELEPKTPHTDSALSKIARSYRNAPALLPRLMQKKTNGQRTGFENMQPEIAAMER